MLVLENARRANIAGTAHHAAAASNSCHARFASVLTACERTRQRGLAQHFLSMYSVVELWCVVVIVVLDYARVVSRDPDLDMEPIEMVLLQVQRRRALEDEEPSRILHVVVARLRWDGDATMSARI